MTPSENTDTNVSSRDHTEEFSAYEIVDDELTQSELKADFAPTQAESAARAHDFQDLAHIMLSQARSDARGKRLRPSELKPDALRSGGRSDLSRTRSRGAREPLALGDAVKKLLFDRGWDHHLAVGRLMGDWPAIVGEDLALHCEPTSFQDGILTIQCSSTTYATSLKLLMGTLHERIATEVGQGTVQKIEILGPKPPKKFKGPLRVSGGRGPRDTYG